jgi:hypothetical protein
VLLQPHVPSQARVQPPSVSLGCQPQDTQHLTASCLCTLPRDPDIKSPEVPAEHQMTLVPGLAFIGLTRTVMKTPVEDWLRPGRGTPGSYTGRPLGPRSRPTGQGDCPHWDWGWGGPGVFETFQHALSSLEAAAADWCHQPLSCPGPIKAESRNKAVVGTRGAFREQEGAGGCLQEVSHCLRGMPGCS